jgi:hypothetical protein
MLSDTPTLCSRPNCGKAARWVALARFPSDPEAPEIVLYALCDDHKRQLELEQKTQPRPPLLDANLRRKVARAFRRAGLKVPPSGTAVLTFLRLQSSDSHDGPEETPT